ncbi:MAG: tyrosine-type recombinase/integrase [Lachnospiraceae bacterium]|nr:tyrosine-type recombinase/integrase [Lachnospiraceae bacterium]
MANRPVAKDRTKNDASYRGYPIPDWARKHLDNIHMKQEMYKSQFGNTYTDLGYIFTWEDGRPYRPDYLTKRFKKLVKSDDRLDNSLTLHSLRASCVSILIHQGVDIKDVQAWVGHRDIQTTLNVYARTNEARKEKTADLMSDVIFKKSAS